MCDRIPIHSRDGGLVLTDKHKVYKRHEMFREKVRLNREDNYKIDNKKGAWYEVIWYSDGTFEREVLSACGITSSRAHIPFNPMVHDSFDEHGWGDEKNEEIREDI